MKLILGINHEDLENWLSNTLGAEIVDSSDLIRDVRKVAQHITSDFVVVGTWLPDAMFIPASIREMKSRSNLVIMLHERNPDNTLAKEILREAAAHDVFNVIGTDADGSIDADALLKILLGQNRTAHDLQALIDKAGMDIQVADKPNVQLSVSKDAPVAKIPFVEVKEPAPAPAPVEPPKDELPVQSEVAMQLEKQRQEHILHQQSRQRRTARATEPIQREELVDPFEHRARSESLVIAGSGFKGGIGKTTVIANTAVGLAKRGLKVCAIDLNFGTPALGAHLGVGLLDKKRKPILGIGHLAQTAVGELESVESITYKSNGVYVIAGAPTDVRMFMNPSEDDIAELILRAKEEFDAVLLDTEQAIDDVGTLEAMIHADDVLFVVNQDRAALQEIRNMYDFAVEAKVNDKFRLVLNNYRKPDYDIPSKEEIESFIGLKSALVIEEDPSLLKVANQGKPYTFTGTNKKAWEKFIDRLLNEQSTDDETPERETKKQPKQNNKKGGFLSFLFS